MKNRYRTIRAPRRHTMLFLVLSLVCAQVVSAALAGAGVDIRVNDPTTDTGEDTTQSETSLAYGNGVLCAGFNDFGPSGLSGFGRSTDMGLNWNDIGGLGESGDPVIVHHITSDTFYYASLGSQSIRVASSTDGCQTFGAAVSASIIYNTASNSTTLADKPWIAVDNSGLGSDGNLYICWTRFIDTSTPSDGTTETSELLAKRSTDGGTTWTNEQVIGAQGTSPFGCNIQVDSGGDVHVVWADRANNNIVYSTSTDQGVTYSAQATINSGALRAPGTDNVVSCGTNNNRTTLNGGIRMLAQAWMAVDNTGGTNDGNLYVVFASDPANTTDQSDVFFTRSTNGGGNWSNMVQLGGGGGNTDQFEPNVAVADNGDVGVVWYDRRNDTTNNLLIDVYTAFSSDGGANFGALTRVTDQSFGLPQLNPIYSTNIAGCYMGEYLSILGQGGGFYYLWGDNRNTVFTLSWPAPTGRLDPDVYFDAFPGPSNVPPVVDVDAAAGNEGSAIGLSATATDADGDFLLYSWSVAPLGGVDPGATCTFSDTTVLDPTITCSDNGQWTITLTVTGDTAGVVQASNTLTVANVSPSVTATTPDTTIDEGDTFDFAGTFSDPGWNDTYTGAIDWDFPAEGAVPATVNVTTSGPPQDLGTIAGSRIYGDNGVFDVTATVTDDNGGSGSDTVQVTVNNVDPTAVIDLAGSILVNGVPTFLANAGDPLNFSANTKDPGSDDLTLTWDWDDGLPAPDVTVVSLVNDPALDPPISPSNQPRDVTDNQVHAFGDACRYDIVFDSTDDDGGYGSDSAVVIIVGNSDQVRSAGYWQHQYRGNGKIDFTTAELDCYLAIVDFVSTIFSEVRPAGTIAEALDVLEVNGKKPMAEILDRQLLAALLNFANGSVAWDQLIDTNGDFVGDTPFSAVIAAAEAVRANPASTKAQLEAQKNLLERINLGLA